MHRENMNLRLIVKYRISVADGILEQAALPGDTQGKSVAFNAGGYAGQQFLFTDARGGGCLMKPKMEPMGSPRGSQLVLRTHSPAGCHW